VEAREKLRKLGGGSVQKKPPKRESKKASGSKKGKLVQYRRGQSGRVQS